MKNNIYCEGKETYPLGQIIFENLVTIGNVAIGTFAMWGTRILAATYLIYTVFMLVIFLRKHLCTHCYYYGRACHCGWGKIAMLFKKESGRKKLSKYFAGLTWIILMVFPIFYVLFYLIFNFQTFRIIQLSLLVILLTVQTIIHKRNCSTCKMKYICQGSTQGKPHGYGEGI